MYKIIFFCFLWIMSITLFAQTTQKALDSLEKLVKNSPKKDTNLIKNYIKIGVGYLQQNNSTKAIDYLEKSLQISQQLNDKKFIAFSEGEMGNVYMLLGDYKEAIQHTKNAIQIAEEIKNEKLQALYLQILGKIYERQNKLPQAKELYLNSLKIYQRIDKKGNFIANAYNNLGNISAIMSEFDNALDFQMKALEIRKKDPNQEPNLIYSYNDIAFIYTSQGKFKEANIYYEKAIELGKKFKNDLAINLIYANLASNLVALNQPLKALPYAEQALKTSEKLKSKMGIYNACAVLASVHKSLKNYEKSVEYYELFAVYKDSVLNEKQMQEITKIENNFKVEKEKRKNELLEKEKTITYYIITGGILGVVFLLITALMLWRNNILKQKNNQKLQEKNEEIKQRNEEINQQNEEIRQIADNLQEANIYISNQNHIITQQNKNLLDNITYAQRIQEAMLPNKDELKIFLPHHFILFQPKDIVSGDFYFCQKVENKIIIAAIDCTGHGVSGAFMTILANTLLNDIINNQKIHQPNLILNELHKGIRKELKQAETNNRDGMDITILVTDEKHKKIQFAGAKNSLIYIQNNELKQIKGDRLPIGGEQREIQRLFTLHEIEIDTPIYCYLFSDGYQDQFGGKNRDKFMLSNLKNLLLENHLKPFSEQKNILVDTLQNWINEANETQIDDILMIGVKVEKQND